MKPVTQAQLARILGLSATRIRQLSSGPDVQLPRRPDGRYAMPDSVRSYIELREREAVRKAGLGATDSDYERARTQRMEALAALESMRAAERRNELIPLTVHEARLADFVGRVNAALRGLRGRWAPHLVGIETIREAQLRVGKLANELLAELRTMDLTEPDPYTSEGDAA